MKLIPFDRLPVVDVIKIIDFYSLTPDQIKTVFGFSSEEIDDMREFLNKCKDSHIRSKIQDVADYDDYIKGTKTFLVSSTIKEPPPKNSSKILKAYQNIPSEFVPAQPYCDSYNVSLATLKQINRFDKTNLPGVVTFKTIDGIIMVRRVRRE